MSKTENQLVSETGNQLVDRLAAHKKQNEINDRQLSSGTKSGPSQTGFVHIQTKSKQNWNGCSFVVINQGIKKLSIAFV